MFHTIQGPVDQLFNTHTKVLILHGIAPEAVVLELGVNGGLRTVEIE